MKSLRAARSPLESGEVGTQKYSLQYHKWLLTSHSHAQIDLLRNIQVCWKDSYEKSFLFKNGPKTLTDTCCCCCQVASVVSDSVRPHRQQPTRLRCPWDSPGKNPGVGCHFLLQCTKVKSESEIAQSWPSLSDPMDCSPPGASAHGIFQVRVLEWVTTAFSE